MTEHFWGANPEPPRETLRASQVLGTAAKALLVGAAVVLVLGGIAVVGFAVLLIAGLNSLASNK